MIKYIYSLLLVIALVGCGETSEPGNNEAARMPAEQKLAILDAGTPVKTDDIKVVRIKTLLEKLSQRFNEPIDSIAESTSRGKGVIHDNGIEVSTLEILENVNNMGNLPNTKYRDAVVMYAMAKVK